MTKKKKEAVTTRSKWLNLYLNRSKKRKRIQKRAKNKINRKNKITSKKKQLVFAVEEVSPLVEKEVEGAEGVSPLVEKAAAGVSSLVVKAVEGVSPLVKKYWFQRYNLFSRFDEGIRMDEEGWFSVTPEEIAIKHAERCGGGTVIDCFAGVGGNAIQFARMCYHVVAIDIDPRKIELAINNARVYGVEDYIDFVVGDFFQLASSLKGDVAFLSPPWGGPTYSSVSSFTLDLLKPKDGYSIFQAAQRITPNIIMFLPRNVELDQVEGLSWLSCPPLNFEVEENYVQGRLKAITTYFGNTAALPATAS